MADTALDVLPLADLKQELRIDTDDFDSRLTRNIESAVAFVAREIGFPLIDRVESIRCWRPATTEPLCIRGERVVEEVGDVSYWTPAGELRADPDGTVAAADLGRVDIQPNRLTIYPPAAGWPEILDGSWLLVSLTRAFPADDWPDVRHAVILTCRAFYNASDDNPSAYSLAAAQRLIDSIRDRTPAKRLSY